MNNLRVFNQFKSIGKSIFLKHVSVRTAYVETEDWIPGKRPTTEEEKIKAAKKYNLLPEEYQPQPDDGLAQGDYPDLPTSHHDNRDPFYPWDYPIFRTNYGEALPDTFNITTYDKYNEASEVNQRLSVGKQFIWFLYAFVPTILLVYLLEYKYKYYPPTFGPYKYEKGVTRYEYPK